MRSASLPPSQCMWTPSARDHPAGAEHDFSFMYRRCSRRRTSSTRGAGSSSAQLVAFGLDDPIANTSSQGTVSGECSARARARSARRAAPFGVEVGTAALGVYDGVRRRGRLLRVGACSADRSSSRLRRRRRPRRKLMYALTDTAAVGTWRAASRRPWASSSSSGSGCLARADDATACAVMARLLTHVPGAWTADIRAASHGARASATSLATHARRQRLTSSAAGVVVDARPLRLPLVRAGRLAVMLAPRRRRHPDHVGDAAPLRPPSRAHVLLQAGPHALMSLATCCAI